MLLRVSHELEVPANQEWGLCPLKTVAWTDPLSETNSHHFLGFSCPEAGRKQGLQILCPPWAHPPPPRPRLLDLPLPCPTTDLEPEAHSQADFPVRQQQQLRADNPGTWLTLCQEPKGTSLSQWADLEKSCPQMGEMGVGNVPTADISLQRSSAVEVWDRPSHPA